jgi:carbonic anhydrase
MLTFENKDIYPIINKNLGQGATGELEAQSFDFRPFPDLEEAVREDVEFLRKSQLVGRGIEVSGWVYEVETGRVRRVA